MSTDVLVYSEDPEIASEILTPALEFAHSGGGRVVLMSLGGHTDGAPSFAPGADAVLKVSLPGVTGEPTPEVTARILADVCRQRGIRFVFTGSTRDGKEVAGRLAFLLEAAVATDCISVKAVDGKVSIERMVFGGRAVSKGVLKATSCVVAIKPRSYAPPPSSGPSPTVEEVVVQPLTQKVRVVREGEVARGSVDLTKAEKIVAVGRGLKKKEDLDLVRQLADVLGASIGCSRPLSSDLGWLPEDAHIGLTGVQVKPKLYLAVGISGQLQHVAGIKESKCIVAINSDKSAPIFQNCDYGAVGDLYQVVPELIKQVKSRK
ncbi:MAG: electron transfer flavoprotein subunit alpha/FixB family protein [Nitrososphaerota archaeon]|jgi:electron transfer flavoprotein alpha subunit|nr:electron transfer flavoprotein subunit alpha/FixB family protein [Nitrososphaerota archaeon]